MEVILREDIEKLGARGQVVKVASGYARNFLLPKRMAVAATEANKKIVEQERQAHLKKEAKVQGEAQELAKIMTGATVRIAQKAGENDQLFGSVTSKDIAEALSAQNYNIDRRKIQLEDPIRFVHHPHAASAAPERRFDHQRVADLAGDPGGLFGVRDGFLAARDAPDSGLLRQAARGGFVAQQVEQAGRGADEGDAGAFAGARQSGVLGEESVARVDGVHTLLFGQRHDAFDIQVGF